MEFSRQEHWSRLPFLSQRDLPNLGIEPCSPTLQADSLTLSPQGNHRIHIWWCGSQLWKILKEMGLPDHLTYLLRNMYAGREATVRTRNVTMDWFKIGKGARQGCILSPCLFNLYAEHIMQKMLGCMRHKLESRMQGEILITSDMQRTPPLWQKAKRN